MTDYIAHAEKQAAAYAAKRKKQATDAIAEANKVYDARQQAAREETAAAVREAEQNALDVLDTEAVTKQLQWQQVREAMANWGLTGSGSEQARLRGVSSSAHRREQTAHLTRDEATAALSAALKRTEQEIADARRNTVLTEKAAATEDALTQRNKLLGDAYDAAAKEEAARIKAEQAAAEAAQKLAWEREKADKAAKEKAEAARKKEEEAAAKAAQKAKEAAEKAAQKKKEDAAKAAQKAKEAAEKAAQKKKDDAAKAAAAKAKEEKEKAKQQATDAKAAAKAAESNRKKALEELLDDNLIQGDIYAEALVSGWSPSRAIQAQEERNTYDKIIEDAQGVYQTKGFNTAMAFVAKYDLPDAQLDRLCTVLKVTRPRVDKALAEYQRFVERSPLAQRLDSLF